MGEVWEGGLAELRYLRHELHRQPELSHEEGRTAEKLRGLLAGLDPSELLSGLGGEGLVAVFGRGQDPLKALLRCELDALPIEELSEAPYRSRVPGRAHACGHDGHMVIALGLAVWLARRRHDRGRVAVLFQPAEEVGEGAAAVLADERLERLAPERVFALHNLPGFPLGEVILGQGPFASASRGLVARLEGRTSHAAEPHRGRSPALALAQAILGLTALPQVSTPFERSALITIVGARLGERAFGTSPGSAELFATLRAGREEELRVLWEGAERLLRGLAALDELELKAVEDFPATVNDPRCVDLVERAAREVGAAVRVIDGPFPWSEDFGHFTRRFSGCLFGLGAGEDHRPLHDGAYDFPDELIEPALRLLIRLVEGLDGDRSEGAWGRE